MAVFTEVARDVAVMRCGMVNVAAVGDSARWVLIDAGFSGYGPALRAAAETRFGPRHPPEAILLTHGHFDHVGGLHDLLAEWDVPVYAHRLEVPYLSGRSPYPPADPLVGRGALAFVSRAYPRGPIDIGSRLHPLAADGIPSLPDWRWIHTPGHTAGHVSFFRERDRVLVAGDALTTTRQESVLAVLSQRAELHGPPAYFTQDWDRSRDSVRVLARLAPELLVAGHGRPWAGGDMRRQLENLARRFDEMERPRYGRYTKQPAVTDATGVVMLPPDPLPVLLAGAGAMMAAAGLVWATTAIRREIRS
jgi:glyoxylase-like metal-dependent hydrolase (beta-lactamase superfamily II)